MSKLRELIRYICSNYPHSNELSNARLTKMVYLADWEHSRVCGHQITDVEWYFNNYGPFVDDILREAHSDPHINVIHTTTMYGTPKVQLELSGEIRNIELNEKERKTADRIIDETKEMFWNRFIKHVYNTYPIKSNTRHSQLDLVQSAQEEQATYRVDT